jgi:pyruvate/2-oxoacid:ferredoxin oxidoreductase beta subunit
VTPPARTDRGLRFLDESIPYAWCPGCSHGLVADALGTVLERFADDADRVVLVSDIGCVGLIDRHFRAHTFHGLHGRSITYGTGLKLARPELRVFVVLGDGACGIGGHHLVQAARRGVPMTVVVFDNFNYGMTGGQQSTTTPFGAVTSSSPFGAAERPLDVCALAAAAGATFVARVAAFDPALPEVLARAAAHPGFAIVDVWEFCTAHFAPQNHFRRQEMLEFAKAAGMDFGVLRDAPPPRPTTSVVPEEAPRPVRLETVFTSPLDRPLGVVVAGSAGQKIKSAALALGRAAVRSGLHATQKDDYPITVRTGHSVSEVIVSPRPVGFTGIEAADVAIVLAKEGAVRSRAALAAMPGSSLVLADTALELPPTQARVERADFGAAARKFGATHVAVWAIARWLERDRSVPPDAFRDTVARFTSAAYVEAALRAVDG